MPYRAFAILGLSLLLAGAVAAGEPAARLKGDGFAADVMPNGDIRLLGPDAKPLMEVRGLDLKWVPVRTAGGAVSADGEAAAVAYQLVDYVKGGKETTPNADFKATLTVAPQGGMLVFAVDLSGPADAKTGGVMLSRRPIGSVKWNTREVAAVERSANPSGELAKTLGGKLGVVSYAGDGVKVFEITGGNPKWSDGGATHLRARKAAAGEWKLEYVLIPMAADATPEAALALFENDGVAPAP